MKCSPSSGVTLLETLIALALMAFIALGLSSSISFGIRLLEHSESLSSQNQELAYRIRLRNWLANTTPTQLLTSYPVGLTGEEETLQFYTLQTPQASESAYLRVRVLLERNELQLEVDEFSVDNEFQISRRQRLAKDVTGLKISYFGLKDGFWGWTSTWQDSEVLPSLVRLELDSGSQPDWPELTVRLQFAERTLKE